MESRSLECVNSGADLRGLLAYGCGRHVTEAMIVVVLEDEFREVESGGWTTEVEDGGVVGASGGDGGGVRAEPDPGTLVGFSDLRHPLTPLPHPDPPVRLILLLLSLLSHLVLCAATARRRTTLSFHGSQKKVTRNQNPKKPTGKKKDDLFISACGGDHVRKARRQRETV